MESKLNLTEGFDPFIYRKYKNINYDYSTFPGGEPNIKIKDIFLSPVDIYISCKVNSFNDIGKIAVAVDAIRKLNVGDIHIYIPYFPAARQDRYCNYGEALTVKVYADIINSFNFKSVTILDPHSDVAPALINNCIVNDNFEFISNVICDLPSDYELVSPDAGSNKKMHNLKNLLFKDSFIRCDKHRDSDGRIESFEVYSNKLDPELNYLIVDDICDGGGTFLGLAKKFRELGAEKIYLAVTHGIFSKGFGELNNHFDKIYTTDSFDGQRGTKVKEIKL